MDTVIENMFVMRIITIINMFTRRIHNIVFSSDPQTRR